MTRLVALTTVLHYRADCDKSKNVADAEQLALEQQNDKSLVLCFSLAKRGKAGYFIRDGILYGKDKILGHEVDI